MKTKLCGKCQQRKPLSEFGVANAKKCGRQAHCKSCRRAYAKRWYAANPDKHRRRVRATKNRMLAKCREYVFAYLQAHACVDCGETDPVVLDFDHVRGKKAFVISRVLTAAGASIRHLKREIKKCDVRCSNCHRRRTAKEGEYWMWRKSRGLID